MKKLLVAICISCIFPLFAKILRIDSPAYEITLTNKSYGVSSRITEICPVTDKVVKIVIDGIYVEYLQIGDIIRVHGKNEKVESFTYNQVITTPVD